MVKKEQYVFISLWLSMALFLMHILQYALPWITPLFVLDGSKIYEIHRFVTSIFIHANINHFLQNAIGIIMFGLILEGIIGWKNFLKVFILSGIAGNVAILIYDPEVIALGSSGALMGIVGAAAYLRPFMPIYFYAPLPLISLAAIYVIINIIGIIYPTDNIGYAAHLGGFIFGVVWAWKNKEKYGEEKPKMEDDEDIDDEEAYKIVEKYK